MKSPPHKCRHVGLTSTVRFSVKYTLPPFLCRAANPAMVCFSWKFVAIDVTSLPLAYSANFIKLTFMVFSHKIFWWGCFAHLVYCARGQLFPLSAPRHCRTYLFLLQRERRECLYADSTIVRVVIERAFVQAEALKSREICLENQHLLSRIAKCMIEPSQIDNHKTWERPTSVTFINNTRNCRPTSVACRDVFK